MLSSYLRYLLVTILIVLPVVRCFELPFLKTCTIEDEACHIDKVNIFFEKYGNGIEGLDLPSLDPMYLGNITINGNSNDNFNLQLTMEDAKLYKFPVLKCLGIKGFSKDTTKPMRIVMKTLSPQLILTTRCHIKGKLLIFSVQGDTDLVINIKNLTTTMRSLTKFYTKDGKVYIKSEELKPKLDIGSLSTTFKNSTLFNGDPVFMDTFAETINGNWPVLRDEIEPHLNAAVAKIAIEAINKVLATMSYDRFFKEE